MNIQTSTQQKDDTTNSTKKLTQYKYYYANDLKDAYMALLNDNIIQLITYIYDNMDKKHYQSPETRVALSMQMVLSSDKLIPINLSSLIAKDIDKLRKDSDYTNQWANPTLKRKYMQKELDILRKHTEIDDTISLNLPETAPKVNMEDFDIHSGMSTLNVSSTQPIQDTLEEPDACILM